MIRQTIDECEAIALMGLILTYHPTQECKYPGTAQSLVSLLDKGLVREDKKDSMSFSRRLVPTDDGFKLLTEMINEKYEDISDGQATP